MIEKILIIALLVQAIYATMLEGMIFEKLGKFFERMLDDETKSDCSFLNKPVSCCVVCMSPWYGTALYWLIYGNSVQEWLIVIIAAMGLNFVLTRLFND